MFLAQRLVEEERCKDIIVEISKGDLLLETKLTTLLCQYKNCNKKLPSEEILFGWKAKLLEDRQQGYFCTWLHAYKFKIEKCIYFPQYCFHVKFFFLL